MENRMTMDGDQISANFHSISGLLEVQKSLLVDDDVNKQQLLVNYFPVLLETASERFEQVFAPNDREDALDLYCPVIRVIFDTLTVDDVFSHQILFLKALSQSPVRVREALIAQLTCLVQRKPDATIGHLCGDSVAILVAVTRAITDETSNKDFSHDFIIHIASHPNGPKLLFACQPFTNELNCHLNAKDEIKFKIYDLTVALSKISSECLEYCVVAGLIPSIVAEIDGQNDVLTQLSSLELLADLTSDAKYAADYFHQTGLVPRLHSLLKEVQSSPDGGFLFPALIRFFGYLCYSYPVECSTNYPQFMDAVFQLVLNFDHMDVPQRLLGFDTLGVIGSTPTGKTVLAKYGTKMDQAMRCFGHACSDGPIDLRVRHLEALIKILNLPLPDQTSGLLELIENWYHKLDHKNSTEFLFSLFKQPIKEIHITVGSLFVEIACQPWAQKVFSQQPGFLEYLLNRSTEHDMDGRHCKFEIVCQLVDSPTITEAFKSEDILQLKQSRRKGPYYVQAEAEIAMEGSDT